MGSSAVLTIQSIVRKEKSPLAFTTYQINAGNLAAWDTAWGTFKTATDAILLGVIRDEHVAVHDNLLDASLPASNHARRELKLLVRYSGDTSGDLFRMEVPCPDLGALTYTSGDANFLDIGVGVLATWVSEAEALMRSPKDATETVTINSVQVVGRNI